MNTIRCGVIDGDAIQRMQQLKAAISVLSALDDSHNFAVSILESKLDDIWEIHVARAVHEYPIDAYKSFVDSEIRKENT